MNKVVGISMLVIGIVLCVVILIRLAKQLINIQEDTHIVGQIGGALILIALGAFLIRSGLKMIKKV
jgi:hypothetical protein